MTTATERLPRSFSRLNVAQFLGALNDNVFKLLLIFLLLEVLGDDHRTAIIATVSAVFVIPFLLFSNAAGVLADRCSKRRIIVAAKVAEIALMALGGLAVWSLHPPALYAILFLMCTQSAFFGPSKYGIIPELVTAPQLSRANSRLVGATYLAIIIGTFLPSFCLDALGLGYAGLVGVCLGIAAIGLAAARGIPPTPPAGAGARVSPLFVREIYRTLRGIRGDRYLLWTVFGSAYFLFLGAYIQQNMLLFGRDHLDLTWEQSGYYFPLAALGIGLGALLAGALSGRHIEFGVVPIGAVGLALGCALLGLLPPGIVSAGVLVLLLGLCAGLFIVPLNAFVQHRSPPAERGRILAAQSFLSFLGVALAAALLALLSDGLKLSPRAGFLVVGLLTAVLAVVAGRVLPDFLLRLVAVTITRGFYRIRATGQDHLPAEGGALLVANHVTWVDALLLSTLTGRRIRFVMWREIMEHHWLRPVFRLMGAIPIASNDPPRQVIAALHQARAALDEGYLVCIFAEGALTRNGNMQAFRPGLERILKGSAYPIIPIHIGGAWGSIFSYQGGRLRARMPTRLPYPIWIAAGVPLPPTTPAHQVRLAVLEAGVDAFNLRRAPARTLAHAFVRAARRHWARAALADSTGQRLTYGRALTGAVALGRALEADLAGQDQVGVLLPATAGGAVVNTAITLTGRVPVNLNFTLARELMLDSMTAAGIRTVLSSRAFLEKLGWETPPPGTLFLEDVRPRIRLPQRLAALVLARFAPAARLMTFRQPGPDDLATIIFSSGSTGRPKGVMLSHHNVLSNIEGFSSVLDLQPRDRICAVLPLFHSFGYTATMWFPLIAGVMTAYHPNPLDAPAIGALVRRHRLTVLLATPTFLSGYLRRIPPKDFATLRRIVTGAEKLKPSLAAACEAHFGVRPREGYGTTELAPVVALNLPDVTRGGLTQVGTREGSVGHPIPGVAVRVTDPDSGRVLGPDEEGLVEVKGPNVMQGYLHAPELTAEVLRDGWYHTGDIGRVDPDGFLWLVDRLSRFSKIGGEMVPHMAIEDRLGEALDLPQNALVVTAVADARKGEQLIMLYTPEAGSLERLRAAIRACEIPNMWKPREDCLMAVDALPVLGSGKLDLRRVKEMAQESVQHRPG